MLVASTVSVIINGTTLLKNASLTARPSEVVVICGPNGAGKSTLLKVLSGELQPSGGTVTLDGSNIAEMKAWQLAERRSVVPQSTHLAFPFTVAEVVSLGLTVPGFAGGRHQYGELVMDTLHRVDLTGFADRSYPTLSGGERQRVHLARALCQLAASRRTDGTRVLFLDEPTASLDLSHQLLVLQEARRVATAGTAVIAVLHDLNLAAAYADQIALMASGRIASIGPPESVMEDEKLSEVFECSVRSRQTPPNGVPYVLPQLCSLQRDVSQPPSRKHRSDL